MDLTRRDPPTAWYRVDASLRATAAVYNAAPPDDLATHDPSADPLLEAYPKAYSIQEFPSGLFLTSTSGVKQRNPTKAVSRLETILR